jgi:hypothetical protein
MIETLAWRVYLPFEIVQPHNTSRRGNRCCRQLLSQVEYLGSGPQHLQARGPASWSILGYTCSVSKAKSQRNFYSHRRIFPHPCAVYSSSHDAAVVSLLFDREVLLCNILVCMGCSVKFAIRVVCMVSLLPNPQGTLVCSQASPTEFMFAYSAYTESASQVAFTRA